MKTRSHNMFDTHYKLLSLFKICRLMAILISTMLTVIFQVNLIAQETDITQPAMDDQVESQADVDPTPDVVTEQTEPTKQTGQEELTEEQPLDTSKSDFSLFRDLISELQASQREIDDLFSNMPVGFPKLQAGSLARIEELKKKVAQLSPQLPEAALKSYKSAPGKDRIAARMVATILLNRLNGTPKFDPESAFEIADLMIKNSPETPQLLYQGFRSSYATHRFDRADEILTKLETVSRKRHPDVRKQLVQTQNKWDRELEFRDQEAAADDLPQVKLETSAGDIVIELFEDHAPQTVGNFINLIEKQFYDDLTFHLVRPGLFVQTGCPYGDGTGDAGYKIANEFDDPDKVRHHFAGTVSMSNQGSDTASSQFFICQQPSAKYDDNYTAFGRVVEGLDVVYQLRAIDSELTGNAKTEPVKLIKTSIIRKRDHEYLPTIVDTALESNEDSIPPNEQEEGSGTKDSEEESSEPENSTTEIPDVDPDAGK